MNILLAEDDLDDCNFFKLALDVIPLSFYLTNVHDGEHLMKYLAENLENLPDIIFLDINMPRKNGLECLIEIKANEKLKNIPVIIISTSADKYKIEESFKSGASVFVRKPGEMTALVQLIYNALPLATKNAFSTESLKYILNA